MFTGISRPPFSWWLSCCHGIGANWSFANMCHWLGVRLMELQPNGTPWSWEGCSLEDLGVLKTCLVVEACEMQSSVLFNIVVTFSEQD